LGKNFTEIVPGEPFRWGEGVKPKKVSQIWRFLTFISETVQDRMSVSIND